MVACSTAASASLTVVTVKERWCSYPHREAATAANAIGSAERRWSPFAATIVGGLVGQKTEVKGVATEDKRGYKVVAVGTKG